MTDFRALCAELAYELDAETGYTRNDGTRITHPTVAEARAALAQPEPQEPTDEELFELSLKTKLIGSIAVAAACHPDKVDPRDACAPAHTATLDFARAVLARWGRPAIEPVPVSERPWEREGWCDAEDTCWAIGQRDSWIRVYVPGRDWSNPAYTHLLPHHALPVPQRGAEG
jgi:hypothetical protein